MKYTSLPTWEDTFFTMAHSLAKRATCPRRSVGCVIVGWHNVILALGYNGAPGEAETCLDAECLIEGGHCVRAVHAEIRALATAASSGINLWDSRAFCTLLPCINCMNALYLAGVRMIHYDESYEREEKTHLFQLAERLGVALIERTR